MKILFIMPHPIEGPSSRFRVYLYKQYLESQGVTVTFRPFLSSKLAPVIYAEGKLALKVVYTLWGTLLRFGDVVRSFRYDAVYILREAFPFGPPVFERLLKFGAGRLLFDFDDAIYMRSLAFDNPLDRLRDWDKPQKLAFMANHIVPGSEYLATWARKFCGPATEVTVLPTIVDVNEYKVDHDLAQKDVVIGWIGTPRGSMYLQDLLPTIREMSITHPGVTWVFVGAEPFDVEGCPVEFREWALAREIEDIQSFTIGLMPLTDDEETRGKCGFKLIQYMSCGVASVSSPVGVNQEVIIDGETGLFASTAEEWHKQILMLVDNPEYCQQCGRNARLRAEQFYSLDVTAPKMLNILKNAVA